MYIIGERQFKKSFNVTFDDTKLPSIQTENASEKLKFNNLLDPDSNDDNTQPEIVADVNNVNNNDDHGYGDGDGGGGGNIDNNGESTST